MASMDGRRHGFADARVIVVGAGMVGSCIGYRLAQEGAHVEVVDRFLPGAGTSGSSFAWLSAFGHDSRDYVQLNLASIRAHGALHGEVGGQWLHRSGSIHYVPDADPHTMFGPLKDIVSRLRRWGCRIENFTLDEAERFLEADLRFGEVGASGVVFVPDEGWVQPVEMVRHVLAAGAREYGLRVRREEVSRLDLVAGGVGGVVLSSGEVVQADVVILAAGAWSGELVPEEGMLPRVSRSYGVLCVTQPCPISLDHVVIGPELAIRPDGGGRLLMSSSALLAVEEGYIPSVDDALVSELRLEVERLVPGMEHVAIEAFRRGIRPSPPDGLPMVGFDDGLPGLYYAVMHSGATLSAGMGEWVARDLLGGECSELSAYRPGRFAA